MQYLELLKAIMQDGKLAVPRGQDVRELLDVRLEVPHTGQIYYWPSVRELETVSRYMGHELAWYFSGERHHAYISKYAQLWKEIANPDDTLNSNYGHLVFYNRTPHPTLGPVTLTPFEWAVKMLMEEPNTRRALITYNTGGFNFPGNRDYICTQHQAFFLRQDVLHCFVALRSSDAIWGLTYNMPWWSTVAQQVLAAIRPAFPRAELAPMQVTIYSAHIYARHYALVDKLLSSVCERSTLSWGERLVPLGKGLAWYEANLPQYYTISKEEKI